MLVKTYTPVRGMILCDDNSGEYVDKFEYYNILGQLELSKAQLVSAKNEMMIYKNRALKAEEIIDSLP